MGTKVFFFGTPALIVIDEQALVRRRNHSYEVLEQTVHSRILKDNLRMELKASWDLIHLAPMKSCSFLLNYKKGRGELFIFIIITNSKYLV